MSYYIYMVRCEDGSHYTGITTDPHRRMREHMLRLTPGAKYTKSRRPCTLVHSEAFDSKSEAMKREAEITKLSTAQKENLILAVSK